MKSSLTKNPTATHPQSSPAMNPLQQENLRQHRARFDLFQIYHRLLLINATISSAIGFAAAIALLLGHQDIDTLTAFSNLLPTLTCHQLIKSGAKELNPR